MNPSPDLGEVLGSGADPQPFWKRMAQALADGWTLRPALLLHVAPGGRVGLLGMSIGSDPAAIPDTVRRAVTRPLQAPEFFQAVDMRWLVVPLAHKGGSIVLVAGSYEEVAPGQMAQLKMSADAMIAAFEALHTASEQTASVTRLTQVLDLGLIVGEAAHFDKAAIAVCNEVAARLVATRVTLGWKRGDSIKLVATSHGGRVRNDTEQAGALARAMDEALEQNVEITFPQSVADVVNEQHRAYAAHRGGGRLLSLPLRNKDGAVGVLTIEGGEDSPAPGQQQVDALRVTLDLVAPHLDELHQRVGWAGARAWRATRKRVGALVGYRHTGWKLAGATLVLALLLAMVIRIDHKVKAPFILKTEASAELTAPFGGYIESVHYKVGDVVKAGQVLVELDKRDMLVQRSEYVAERDRSLNEARKHEGEGDLSQMRLAQLAAEEADARIKVLDYRLSRADLKAPFDGIVVEGDLNERLSSPTQVGESLLRVVRLDGIYAELQVDERDINYIHQGMDGKLAFTSRPDERFDVRLQRYEPVAVVQESGTVFRVRVQVVDPTAKWWRPGMSGLCKIDAGPRSIAWIVFHRTIQWLRLWLWW